MCMGSSGWVATTLDYEMLLASGAKIEPEHVNIDEMTARPGKDVAMELGGRHLL